METFALIAAERHRLAGELATLTDEEWTRPSLCEGWSTHVVAAHLNAPWEVSLPRVLLAVARSRGDLNAAFDRIARRLAADFTPAECVAGLRLNAEDRFTPPASPPEAPLTDVIVHGADILEPLGRSVAVAPEALERSLRWLAAGKAKGFLPSGRVDGLRLVATDLDVECGSGGAVVAGPALAIIGALVGRSVFLGGLSGDGAGLLTGRIASNG